MNPGLNSICEDGQMMVLCVRRILLTTEGEEKANQERAILRKCYLASFDTEVMKVPSCVTFMNERAIV